MSQSQSPNLWVETPLILSNHLSSKLGCNAYLKLENLQPSQAFKYRGVSLFVQNCKATHGDNVHLIIPSGGNAGLAAAYAANQLGLRCTVYLPEGTSQSMINLLKKEKAEVNVVGKYYLESAREARKAVEQDKNSIYVHGYEGPILWKGHSSIITEITQQLREKPDAIVCSVGGGGLLAGVIEGCRNAGWDDVPVVAVGTHGAAAFYHSMSLNDKHWHGPVALPEGSSETYDEAHGLKLAYIPITSKALSLAATSPSPPVVKAALLRKGGVFCVKIPDELAMSTTCLFAEDHKILAELACSSTLAIAYHPDLLRAIQKMHTDKSLGRTEKWRNIVFIVCGGVKISIKDVQEYREAIRRELESQEKYWEVFCNGERLQVMRRPLVE